MKTTLVVLLALSGAAHAQEDPLSATRMREEAQEYYDAEMTSAYLFTAFGAVQAAGGGVAFAPEGDFAKGFAWSSLLMGGVTVAGGIGYGIAVKIRGDRYKGYAARDLSLYKREEEEHIGGTDGRFWLYLGFELLEVAAGLGVATYGLIEDDELYQGIGVGVATNGIGLFVLDVPGAKRAKSYHAMVKRFQPQVAVSLGSAEGRPWGASLGFVF